MKIRVSAVRSRSRRATELCRTPYEDGGVDLYCNMQRCMLHLHIIESFKHRGLKRLYEQGDGSKVRPDQLERIRDVLLHLDHAKDVKDLDLPGYRLHTLKGDLKGYWSVKISGNWRIIFRFEDGDAYEVGLVDYH